MFDDYIDHLAEELESLDLSEVVQDYQAHMKNPNKGFEGYIDKCADGVFYTDQQCETYLEALWDEFDGEAISAIYEARLTVLRSLPTVQMPVVI